MIRAAGLVAVVAGLASCSTDGAGPATAARKDAKAYACPTAGAVTTALGKSVGTPKKSSTGDRTVLCAYTAPSYAATAIVSITFGAGPSAYDQALAVLENKSSTPIAGLGTKAIAVEDRDVRQLIILAGSRVLTVTSDPGDAAHETAVARLFLA